MLKGLDEIDWNSVSHAYGPAIDVPKLLRDLLSKEKKCKAKRFNNYSVIYGIRERFTRLLRRPYLFFMKLLKILSVLSVSPLLYF